MPVIEMTTSYLDLKFNLCGILLLECYLVSQWSVMIAGFYYNI